MPNSTDAVAILVAGGVEPHFAWMPHHGRRRHLRSVADPNLPCCRRHSCGAGTESSAELEGRCSRPGWVWLCAGFSEFLTGAAPSPWVSYPPHAIVSTHRSHVRVLPCHFLYHSVSISGIHRVDGSRSTGRESPMSLTAAALCFAAARLAVGEDASVALGF